MGTNWKLHCALCPQSLSEVERMNWVLKETLTKLALETGGDWVSLFPFALYGVHNSPYTLGLTPLEVMYVRPPLILPKISFLSIISVSMCIKNPGLSYVQSMRRYCLLCPMGSSQMTW